MKVNKLKEELKKRGLSHYGANTVLAKRVSDAIEKGEELLANLSPENCKNIAGDCFSSGAYWGVLQCDGDFVEEKTPEGF